MNYTTHRNAKNRNNLLQWEVFPKLNMRYISPEFFKYGDIGTLAESYHFIRKKDTLISNENIWYHGIKDGYKDTIVFDLSNFIILFQMNCALPAFDCTENIWVLHYRFQRLEL